MSGEQLFKAALGARELAYAPYSNFAVGAALLSEDGSIYLGANIENSSYGATCCAERVALFKAVSEGKLRFSAIAIVGGGVGGELVNCYPCGICRQALAEFCDGGLIIYTGDENGIRETTLGALLPCAFELEDRNLK